MEENNPINIDGTEVPELEAEIKEIRNDGQKQIAAAILVAGLVIAGAILLKGNGGTVVRTENTDNNPVSVDIKIRPIAGDEHILGNPNADIFVVEYSDTECPFCKMFHSTMHTVIAERSNGKVAWVYRHFPIPELHKKAFHEAEATECAWEQGGNTTFWKYVDEIYVRTGSNDKLDPAELPKIAEAIGLNLPAFNTCLDSGKFRAKVQSDIDDGIQAGVRGTPSSFIVRKGKIVDTIGGAQQIEVVRQQIENALK